MSIGAGVINGVLALLLAPMFEGVVRKVKAIIHSRQGPPLLQPYIDIMKLFGKEDLRCASSIIFRFAPAGTLAVYLVVALITPMGLPGVGLGGDMITWFFFMILGLVALIIMAASSGNPFAETGAAREIMLLLSVEPIVVAGLITAAMKSGGLQLTDMMAWNLTHGPSISMIFAGIALFLAFQPLLSKMPSEMAEADMETAEGLFMEQSGPNLALIKIALLIRQMVYCFLLVQVFVPWPAIGAWPLSVCASFAKVLIVFVLATVVNVVCPRLRVDQAVSYMGKVLIIALAAIALASFGL